MKTPLSLLIKKCCLLQVCKNAKTYRNDNHVYLFIPYMDESENRYFAYIEASRAALIELFSDAENEVIDLLSFSRILHIEPSENISIHRLIEIENFYCECIQKVSEEVWQSIDHTSYITQSYYC